MAGAEEAPLVLAAPDEALAFAAQDIAGVDPGDGAAGEAIFIRLAPAATDRLAVFTAAHLGQPVAVILCGREAARPTVMAVIDSGGLVIPAPGDGGATVAALRGEGTCPAR